MRLRAVHKYLKPPNIGAAICSNAFCIRICIFVSIVPLISLIPTSNVWSQADITITVGLIENLQDASNQPQYAVYTEVQLSNEFVQKPTATISGGFYWGYWDDRVERLSSCADCYTYSFRSHIIGARLAATLNEFPIPIATFAGISRHFMIADYIGGGDFAGNIGEDFNYGINAVEFGTRVYIPVADGFSLVGTYQQYYPLAKRNSRYQSTAMRMAFGVGFTYNFK